MFTPPWTKIRSNKYIFIVSQIKTGGEIMKAEKYAVFKGNINYKQN